MPSPSASKWRQIKPKATRFGRATSWRLGDLEAQIPSRALFAIRYYMRVVDSLPETYGPRALFAVATTFDVNLNDRMRAGQAYELFKQRYPQHPWTARVDTLLQLTQSGADTLLMQQIQAKKP